MPPKCQLFGHALLFLIQVIAMVVLACPVRAEDIPEHVDCLLWNQGGDVRGCGMLAAYPAPGPKKIVVVRTTSVPIKEDFAPITLIKVVDPDGHTVNAVDVSDATQNEQHVDLTVPSGKAGIWRVSVQGGRTGDHISFFLPPTAVWGIRGEMALGLETRTPHNGWLWIPSGTSELLMELTAGGNVALFNQQGERLPPQQEVRRQVWRWNELPTNVAVRIALDPQVKSLAIDGIPDLICPNAQSATLLHGDSQEVSGVLVEGPIQAQARRCMLACLQRDLAVHLEFNKALPRDPALLLPTLQLYGQYAPLSGLSYTCGLQSLNPQDSDFGAIRAPDGGQKSTTLHGSVHSPFDAGNLAVALTSNLPNNPAFCDQALYNRAILLAFYHLVHLQGDDLIREGDLGINDYPMTHSFFVYEGALARAYLLLKDHIDAETARVWRDALIAVADRLGNYHGYETNQWWHVILGHLTVYRATGEIRYRRWFERLTNELLSGPSGAALKFGQHPAGYFLEEFGPDGLYDAISETLLVEAFHNYRSLPDADAKLVKRMEDAIARNLTFCSCHWMVQPDGSLIGPTAQNARKIPPFANQGWPGSQLARDIFPLATAKWLLPQAPPHGAGDASIFPYRANTMAWATAALSGLLASPAAKFTGPAYYQIQSAWTEAAIASAQRKVVPPCEIPCQKIKGVWDLPGQLACKIGRLYILTFYDITGAAPLANTTCRMGGAPSAIWSAETGAALLSMHNSRDEHDHLGSNAVQDINDLTHACIFAQSSKGLWWSGREQATLQWISPGRKACRISGSLGSSTVSWEYHFEEKGLDLIAEVVSPGLEQPMLNLPFIMQMPRAHLDLQGGSSARFIAGAGSLDLVWKANGSATVSQALPTGSHEWMTGSVRCLRIPLQRHGNDWSIRVHFTAGGP
jgi:hypothetical protein